MFKRTAALIAHIRELEKLLAAAIEANNQLQQRAFLVSIDTSDRYRVFTFARNGEIHQVKVMGLRSDDIAAWKKELIE